MVNYSALYLQFRVADAQRRNSPHDWYLSMPRQWGPFVWLRPYHDGQMSWRGVLWVVLTKSRVLCWAPGRVDTAPRVAVLRLSDSVDWGLTI